MRVSAWKLCSRRLASAATERLPLSSSRLGPFSGLLFGKTECQTLRLAEMRSSLTPPLFPPRCELCGGAMKLQRSEPQFGSHPELLSFRCQQCGHVVTLVAEDKR
jgi:hypothetical protein